jgi:hypothetical protein
MKENEEPSEALTVQPVELGTIVAYTPQEMVQQASEIAGVLKDVIAKRRLYTNIRGKAHVRCEGWTTCAAMLGVIPREVSNIELEDGSYEAVVELVRIRDQAVIGRASAVCGMDEATWKTRAKYARKSMAATRATGKACRLSFSWIMELAGYEVTPAEEM